MGLGCGEWRFKSRDRVATSYNEFVLGDPRLVSIGPPLVPPGTVPDTTPPRLNMGGVVCSDRYRNEAGYRFETLMMGGLVTAYWTVRTRLCVRPFPSPQPSTMRSNWALM